MSFRLNAAWSQICFFPSSEQVEPSGRIISRASREVWSSLADVGDRCALPR
jgi:hypothetical protein